MWVVPVMPPSLLQWASSLCDGCHVLLSSHRCGRPGGGGMVWWSDGGMVTRREGKVAALLGKFHVHAHIAQPWM